MSVATTVGLVILAIGPSCGRQSSREQHVPQAAVRSDANVAAGARVLLSLPVSAYHASIATDDGDVAYLLTSSAAYRLAPDQAPAEISLDLGFGATTTRSSFVYWSRGGVFETPKLGGPARRLVALAERPRLLVASEARIAWLRRSDDDRFSLHTLIDKKPTTAYTSPGTIDAVTMMGDWVFFVERPAGTDWRIGRVGVTGGGPTFTALRNGRAPAMLAGRRDLTFYEGSRFEVHRLSIDLQHERTLASGFVCSPLAVAERVYCAQVEGIFELQADARPRRLVPGSIERLVTDIAASSSRLLWIVDAGADRLEVMGISR